MLEKHINVSKTARYFILGESSDLVTDIWFVCHGYGQLANYFLKNFEILNDGKNLIVAPEGLNRFYLKGFEGRIAAGWMTKEDRLNEINDYVNFLDLLFDEILKDFKGKKIKINILGFSQGAATVLRWICLGRAKPDNLILWAGFFPTDFLSLNSGIEPQKLFGRISTTIVVGNQDEFLKEDQISEFEDILRKDKINYKLVRFEGKHEIDRDVLKKLLKK